MATTTTKGVQGVHHILLIPGPVLPFMGAALVMATFTLVYNPSHVSMRGSLTRCLIATVFWSAACVLWLSQTIESQAAMWYRWEVLLGLVVELTMIEVMAQSLRWRLPRGWPWYYGLALVILLGASLSWHPDLVPSSQGAWVALDNRLPGMVVLSLGAVAALVVGFGQPAMRTLKRGVALSIAIILGTGFFLTDLIFWTLPAYALGWVAPLLLLLFVGIRPRQKAPLGRVHPVYSNVREVLQLSGEDVLTSRTKGVLAVGWAHLNDIPRTYRPLVLDALRQELAALCRRADRVVGLDTGESLIILPEILFQDERRVLQRVVATIDDAVVLVEDKKIPLAGLVEVGWAWAEPGVSLADVIQEARQSLQHECAQVGSLSQPLP